MELEKELEKYAKPVQKLWAQMDVKKAAEKSKIIIYRAANYNLLRMELANIEPLTKSEYMHTKNGTVRTKNSTRRQ